MENFKPTKYTLKCVATGREFDDAGWALDDAECKSPSLVRANYSKKQLELKPDSYGLYKFCDWLPVKRILEGSSAPVTYKSEALAKYLGLSNLWITLNGYFPGRGAKMRTCSFKETEAYSVCARIDENEDRVLVVPSDNLSSLWFTEPINDCVKLIACEKGGDYYDAINLSLYALKSAKFYSEGGAKNIARRDGMGTTVLSAVTTIGRIPDYYFQAVGSGTGAIAAWEANMRLIEDGSYDNNLMKLIVSQNAPFVPMYDAWVHESREMLPYDMKKARRDAALIDAKVLSNRKPPYAIAGGLYDALKATNGNIMVATNAQSKRACKLFKELEGIDINPAAGVATASLIKMVEAGEIAKDACIMLNITGAGEEAAKKGRELWHLKPTKVFPLTATIDEVVEYVETLF